MRTELIRHINWRITRSMQKPFHMARYRTKLGSGRCPVHRLLRMNHRTTKQFRINFTFEKTQKRFETWQKVPSLPTLWFCHNAIGYPAPYPLLDLSMDYLPMLALLLLYCNWISVNKWTWTWIKKPYKYLPQRCPSQA